MNSSSHLNTSGKNIFRVPEFTEVYELETTDNVAKVICRIIDNSSGTILSFGISRISLSGRFRKRIGKELAYAKAMKYLFLKLSHGKKSVIDLISEKGQEE